MWKWCLKVLGKGNMASQYITKQRNTVQLTILWMEVMTATLLASCHRVQLCKCC
jgi:hypothetical protein